MRQTAQRPKCFLLAGVVALALLATTQASLGVEIGDRAPDFKLPSTNGVDIALSDFRGKKWVFLEFYAAAFVPT